MNKYYKIYRKIKKYNKIVIARHIGPDPDCLASSIALRDVILNKFPNKEVYAVGCPASTFKYLGHLDKFTDDMYDNSLLIVVDTPDKKRIDGVDASRFKDSIKIDHHPFIEKVCKYELVDDTASSASQMVLELIFKTPLKLTKEAGEKLFIGIVADTNRFLFNYTTPKTFNLVSKLIKETGIEFSKLYDDLYMRPIKEIRFHGWIENNMIVTENGFGYIKLNDDILKEYNVDAATAGNMVNDFNYIDEIYAWAVFSYDRSTDLIRGSIRSRGPIINETASHFGGGGHIFASGVRLKDFNEADLLINELDEVCRNYKDAK
ncbi:MAG: bifunctional oligoribonuclease/PAP phosphatase NrnA [Firmicutes bacterium]|nr:bifunctional oligoribonuclease/PAP phosphatase NrnA [Bacillota bacterium]